MMIYLYENKTKTLIWKLFYVVFVVKNLRTGRSGFILNEYNA
jgi:hypothetical protein